MTAKVKRLNLLKILKKNRAEHRAVFLEAQDGYRKAVIGELDKMLKLAKDGKKIQTMVNLTAPMDQTSDYDRIINMTEMTTEKEITLEENEFNQYVLDKWNWGLRFSSSNQAYTNSEMASAYYKKLSS